MERYEINDKTLAVIACDDNLTKIYEEEQLFYVQNNANKIMEDSCEYFGSSLDGRRVGTKSLIGISYKSPIIVEESKEIIFFPTSSLRNNINSWVCLGQIKSYYQKGKSCVIVFHNGTEICLNNSYGSIDNQILRSSRLESALRWRKNGKKTFNMK